MVHVIRPNKTAGPGPQGSDRDEQLDLLESYVRILEWTQEPAINLRKSWNRWRITAPLRGSIHFAVGIWILVASLATTPTVSVPSVAVWAVVVLYIVCSASTVGSMLAARKRYETKGICTVFVLICVVAVHAAFWTQIGTDTRLFSLTLPRIGLLAAKTCLITAAAIRASFAVTRQDWAIVFSYILDAVACTTLLISYEWVVTIMRTDLRDQGATCGLHSEPAPQAVALVDVLKKAQEVTTGFARTVRGPLWAAVTLFVTATILRLIVLWELFQSAEPLNSFVAYKNKDPDNEEWNLTRKKGLLFFRKDDTSGDTREGVVVPVKWTKREIFARSIALPLCAVVVLLIGVDAHLSRMEHTGWDTRPCAQFMMRSVLFFQSLGRDIDYDCADSRPMSPICAQCTSGGFGACTLGEDLIAHAYIGVVLGVWCILDGLVCAVVERKRPIAPTA